MRHSIRAKETAIQLVMINGVARYGIPELIAHSARTASRCS